MGIFFTRLVLSIILYQLIIAQIGRYYVLGNYISNLIYYCYRSN